MKPSELLAETVTPDGVRMTLMLHAGDYYIEVDGHGLMSTRAPGSERALAEIAAAELSGIARPHVLIGGLGLGFTLHAACAALPATASITVVEYFATIVDWNRKFEFQGESDPTADRRVRIEVADVVDVLRRSRDAYDAILLDVDNGPAAWCLSTNRRLYDAAGLRRIRRALRAGGVLAVWSASPSPAFERALTAAGFDARTETVRSRGRKGERHTIFLGRPDTRD